MNVPFPRPAAILFPLLAALMLPAVAQTHANAPATQPPPYTLQDIKIPMPEAGAAGLHAILMLPNLPGKHPLVLIENNDNFSYSKWYGPPGMGPGVLLPEARWFVLRGWAVALILRRGYGDSGGKRVNDTVYCTQSYYEETQINNAKELRAALDYLKGQPAIDADNAIAVGYAMAGSAAMWFAKDGPSQLKAVISFSGGREHLPVWVQTCIDQATTPAFDALGKSSHVPELWFYQKKADWAGHAEAQAAIAAFTKAGGKAELRWLNHPSMRPGLLFEADPKEWTPLAEQFLSSLSLPASVVVPYQEPKFQHTAMALPDYEEYFAYFALAGPNKAYAVGPDGHVGAAWGMLTLDLAKHVAMETCNHMDCKIIMWAGH